MRFIIATKNMMEINSPAPVITRQNGVHHLGVIESLLIPYGKCTKARPTDEKNVKTNNKPASGTTNTTMSASASRTYETQNDQQLDELHSKLRTLRSVRSFSTFDFSF